MCEASVSAYRELLATGLPRVADFEVLRSGKLASWLAEEGVAPLSFRSLRDLVRA